MSTPSGTRASATCEPDVVSRLPDTCQDFSAIASHPATWAVEPSTVDTPGMVRTGAVPLNFRYSTGLPCTSVTSTVPPACSCARSTTWKAPQPTTLSPVTGPPAVTAGMNGVTTALAA